MLNCLQNIFRENHTTVITVQEYRPILKNRELRIQRLDIFFITLWMHTLQMSHLAKVVSEEWVPRGGPPQYTEALWLGLAPSSVHRF